MRSKTQGSAFRLAGSFSRSGLGILAALFMAISASTSFAQTAAPVKAPAASFLNVPTTGPPSILTRKSVMMDDGVF